MKSFLWGKCIEIDLNACSPIVCKKFIMFQLTMTESVNHKCIILLEMEKNDSSSCSFSKQTVLFDTVVQLPDNDYHWDMLIKDKFVMSMKCSLWEKMRWKCYYF